LDGTISGALQRQPGRLTSILETVIAYEQGDWAKYTIFCQAIALNNTDAKKLYVEAVSWACGFE